MQTPSCRARRRSVFDPPRSPLDGQRTDAPRDPSSRRRGRAALRPIDAARTVRACRAARCIPRATSAARDHASSPTAQVSGGSFREPEFLRRAETFRRSLKSSGRNFVMKLLSDAKAEFRRKSNTCVGIRKNVFGKNVRCNWCSVQVDRLDTERIRLMTYD